MISSFSFTDLLPCPCALARMLFSTQGFVTIAAITFVVILVLMRMFWPSRYPRITIYASERYYLDPRSDERHPLPTLGTILQSKGPSGNITYDDLSHASLYLSVIIPAYNEERRLSVMLDEAVDYLESRKCKYELIVVDDGSRDRTTAIAMNYSQKFGAQKIRVITLRRNRGKGGAIRIGILAARGEMLLFADADGATKFADIAKLEQYYFEHRQRYTAAAESPDDPDDPDDRFDFRQFPIVIGSRAHLQTESISRRSWFRTILMYGFHLGVRLLTVRTVRDTQCGFKLFPRRVAHILFTHMHVERWAFDVELLLLAEKLRISIGEIPVRWTEIDGSKLVPIFSWLQMGRDVALIFALYATGIYAYPRPPFRIIHAFSQSISPSSSDDNDDQTEPSRAIEKSK